MSIVATLFTATLVQDSALSVGGLDRETTTDQPFVIVDGVPLLSGSGLKGAAVAIARRFFEPLPPAVSECLDKTAALRPSAWEFRHARPTAGNVRSGFRAGVGILQATGARAEGLLFDREVIPAGTRWDLQLLCRWRRVPPPGSRGAQEWVVDPDAELAEGILAYVLREHWAKHRCWLGAAVARGLGWCHIDDLQSFRLDGDAFGAFVADPTNLPAPVEVPAATPTRHWEFRPRKLTVTFGEYKPRAGGESWGVDMLAIAPHHAARTLQPTGKGRWATPAWAPDAPVEELDTDRAMVMENGTPVLPGASFRGPLRHAVSRILRAEDQTIADPNRPDSKPSDSADPASDVFGTVENSSRLLIRDARAFEPEDHGSDEMWAAAKLHMHAEDEFSAGSYLSAKRDAVRLLRGTFAVELVIDAKDAETADRTAAALDHALALGAIGHLPIGGHKTRGAGWGTWTLGPWERVGVPEISSAGAQQECDGVGKAGGGGRPRPKAMAAIPPIAEAARLAVDSRDLDLPPRLSLAEAAAEARKHVDALVAWWCEPAIDLSKAAAVATFGWDWPDAEHAAIDEAIFFAAKASWRIGRRNGKWRAVLARETADGAHAVVVSLKPARLIDLTSQRFLQAAAWPNHGDLVVREWRDGKTGEMIAFTMERGEG